MLEPGFQTKQSDFTTHPFYHSTGQHAAEGALAVSGRTICEPALRAEFVVKFTPNNYCTLTVLY